MKKNKSSTYSGSGVYQNDVTRDLNRVAFQKNLRTQENNDAWREGIKNGTIDRTKISFREFVSERRGYRKRIVESEDKRLRKRWGYQGPATKSPRTIWEKIEKDLVFEYMLRQRKMPDIDGYIQSGEPTFGYRTPVWKNRKSKPVEVIVKKGKLISKGLQTPK